MKKILLLTGLFAAWFVGQASAQTTLPTPNTLLVGTFMNAGQLFTGSLWITLQQPATVLISCGGPLYLLPSTAHYVQVVNGALQGSPRVWGADCMNPGQVPGNPQTGIPYNVEVRDQNNNTLVRDQWIIAGPTFDVGTAVSILSPPAVNYVAQTGAPGPTGPTGPAGPPGGSMSYPGVVSDSANGLAVTGAVASASIMSNTLNTINVKAAPYNAKCDVVRGGSNVNFVGSVSSGWTFTAADVNKSISGMTNPASGPVSSYYGTILSVSGGNATVSFSTPGTAGSPTVLYVWKYGTDDQTAIQAAFDAAYVAGGNNNPQYAVYFPAGACMFSTINWRGQSFFGAGTRETLLYGMPGKDMFSTPDTGLVTLGSYTLVHHLKLIPDVSVDASGAPGGTGTYANRIAGMYYKPAGSAQTGTITTAASSTAVVGQGSLFSLINPGQTITAGGETHTVASVQDDTHMTTDAWTGVHTVVTFTAAQAGTVTTAASNTTVIGTGTVFTTSVTIGQQITAGGETHLIRAITDNTHITTDAWTGTYSSVTYTTQGLTQYSPKISPGPMLFGPFAPVTGNNGQGGATCGGASGGTTPTSTTINLTCTSSPFPNLTNYNSNRTVGSQILINGAGPRVSITSWSITGNVATFQATNTLNVGDTIILGGFGTTQVTQTGTVTTTSLGTAVVGVGTSFTTSLVVGATITVGSETHSVTAITDNTHLTTAAWTNAYSGATFTASNMGTYLNTMQPYPVLAAGLSGSQFSITYVHANQFSLNDSAYAGTDYVGTVSAIGTYSSNTQSLTISPAVTNLVTNSSGHLLTSNTPPWFFGNAVFAIQCSNTATCGQGATQWKFQDIVIITQGGGYYMQYNHTVGIWQQIPNYAGVIENVTINYLYGCYIEAPANIGQASNSTPDTWTAKEFTISGCSVPMVTYSGNDRAINGLYIYASGGIQSLGPFWLSNYTGTNSATQGYAQNWGVNATFIEGSLLTSGEESRIMSGPMTINSSSHGTGNAYVAITGSNGNFNGAVGDNIRVYGNANTFTNVGYVSARNIQDFGQGNIFDKRWASGANSYMGRRFNPSFRPYKDDLGKLNADFLALGNSGTPYASLDDLLTTCEDWAQYWAIGFNNALYGNCMTDFSYASASELTPMFFRSAAPTTAFSFGGAATNAWSGRPRVFGQSQLLAPQFTYPNTWASSIVPMVKSTVFIRARCVGATTCNGRFYIGGFTVGAIGSSPFLTFTNNWSTQSFTTDLSTAPAGDVMQLYNASWTNTGTNWDLEWFAVVPQRADPLTAPSWFPNTLYSAAGTVIPTCVAANKGQEVTVSDATATSGTYVSGGTNTVPVICSGTAWLILATGTVSGGSSGVTVTITTASSVTMTGTYGSYYNQAATVGTAIGYTLPTPAAGTQQCVKNSNNGTAADTGILTVTVASTGTQSIIYNGAKSSSGNMTSGGAAGDSACFIAISTTQWEAYPSVGVWTLH